MYSEIDGEIVILSVEVGAYYNLNDVGSIIWKLLNYPTSFDQIIEKLVSKYSIDLETCKKDTQEYLEEMLSAGIIEIAHE